VTKFLQLLAFLVLLGVPLTQQWVPLEILKLRIFDALVEEKEVSNYFSILSIDEKDVQKENGYPFPRKRLAQIQTNLLKKVLWVWAGLLLFHNQIVLAEI
jgi:CHASE2 domain-containing sensor protein